MSVAEAWGYAYGFEGSVVWVDADDEDIAGLMVMVECFLVEVEQARGGGPEPGGPGGDLDRRLGRMDAGRRLQPKPRSVSSKGPGGTPMGESGLRPGMLDPWDNRIGRVRS